MKALSIRPPWPYAIFLLEKDGENRDWHSNYRGPLLIHASKSWDQRGYDFLVNRMDKYVPSKKHHVYGAIVGIVDMVGCVDEWDSEWFFGDWFFLFENAREFQKPISWRGQLGFFDVPVYGKELFRER